MSPAGQRPSGPRILLHLEGLAVLGLSLLAYRHVGGSWGQFALLFFVPDLAMLGYVAGLKAGAWTYNAFHTYLGPILLGAGAFAGDAPALLPWALVWSAHIGFDRLLGYGLKYPTGFKDTHLQRL